MWSDLLFRVRALLSRPSFERQLDDELRFHLERQTEKHVARGLARQEAARLARIELGLEQVKEECRSSWGVSLVETVMADLRVAGRMLWKSRGFTAAAVLTLALGIGASSAIFSVVNAVLLRPLPYRDSARLVTVLQTKPSQGLDWLFATANDLREWQVRSTSFESLAGSFSCAYRMSDQGVARLLRGSCASASFFPLLGVKPLLGRLWTPEEDVPGRDRVAVLAYDTWQREFGGDPAAIGRTVARVTDGQPFTVIGVLPPDFQFGSEDIAVWSPMAIPPDAAIMRFHMLLVLGRLRPGVTLEQAQAEMNKVGGDMERTFPQSNTGWGIIVSPMKHYFAEVGNTRSTLLLLLGAVAALLLIACANVANLLLARGAARQRELAVRIALGATRARVARQLLTESLLLGIIGGAAGLLGCGFAFRPMLALAPHIPTFQPNAVRLDATVVMIAMAATLLATLLFGAMPALRLSSEGLRSGLAAAGRGQHGGLRHRATLRLLVISEIGLAMVLLAATGLLVTTLRNLQRDRPGFNPERLLTLEVCCLDSQHYSNPQQIATFSRSLFERLRAIPGVQAVSSTNALPDRQFDGAGSQFQIRGRATTPGHENVSDFRVVESDYFPTMEIPLVRGRLFTAADDENAEPVALVNESMAQRYFPGGDPIGQQVLRGGLSAKPRWFRIAGIVTNSRDRGAGRETRSTIYVNNVQNPAGFTGGFTLLVRSKGDPRNLESQVRDAVRSVDRDLTTGNARSMQDVMSASLLAERFLATLLTVLATIALCLAAVGVYGVSSYAVAQRTHEIGVRLALGAKPSDVLLLVIGEAARMGATGVLGGLVAALPAMRLFSGLLFGVKARDPLTLLLVGVLLSAVAMLAACVPARRAMSVDPLVALRYD
jgi:putative ABC transport system permease protein